MRTAATTWPFRRADFEPIPDGRLPIIPFRAMEQMVETMEQMVEGRREALAAPKVLREGRR
jgi:hypothetical protein